MHAGVRAAAAGWAHSMILKQDGSVWAAGRNHKGQFGDGTTIDRTSFVEVVPSGRWGTLM